MLKFYKILNLIEKTNRHMQLSIFKVKGIFFKKKTEQNGHNCYFSYCFFFKLDNLREIIKQNIIDRISRVTFPINVICILFSVVML